MTLRLERSMLFVPATQWHMIQKAAASAADAVCIDLEDAVAPDLKAGARANVIRAFQELDFQHRLRMFRINGLDTPYAYRDLIEVVEAAGARIDLVMVPKVNGPDEVAFVDRLLGQIEAHARLPARLGIEAQIETARGFLYVREIAAAAPRLEALIFGAGDYSASMQMPSSAIGASDAHDAAYPGHRWHAPMHAIVAAARANGLRCQDSPYAAYRDPAGFERACHIARVMGFDGKQCIHPAQLAIANAAFSPSADETRHARRVLAAYQAAVAAGQGAATLDGAMIDAANVRMATVVAEKSRLSER